MQLLVTSKFYFSFQLPLLSLSVLYFLQQMIPTAKINPIMTAETPPETVTMMAKQDISEVLKKINVDGQLCRSEGSKIVAKYLIITTSPIAVVLTPCCLSPSFSVPLLVIIVVEALVEVVVLLPPEQTKVHKHINVDFLHFNSGKIATYQLQPLHWVQTFLHCFLH